MGNMDSVIFLGGREHTTVKELSESLGKETISMQTEGRSRGQSESYNQNTQRLGKELMTVDELMTMDGNKCILQLRGLRPFLSPKYDLRKHPNFKYTAEADKKNSFDPATLISTKLTVKPEDTFTVYEADAPDESIGEDEDILNYDDLDDPDAYA
jgi:type IV secretion system protein VirD4